jgi:hypothetical protein
VVQPLSEEVEAGFAEKGNEHWYSRMPLWRKWIDDLIYQVKLRSLEALWPVFQWVS